MYNLCIVFCVFNVLWLDHINIRLIVNVIQIWFNRLLVYVLPCKSIY